MPADTVLTPDWRTVLAREIARDPRGKAGIAQRLGVSRCYVSRVTSGGVSALAAVSPRFVSRVYDLESDVGCPATGGMIARRECLKALAPAPTHNPQAMRIWRECQTCAMKPHPQRKESA